MGVDRDEQGRPFLQFSPRYAPPEVLARRAMRSHASSFEDDKAADVYSMGAVIWEVVARQVCAPQRATHTHTHIHTYPPTHTHTHTERLTHARTHTCTLSFSLT
jgi:hypothetical protein